MKKLSFLLLLPLLFAFFDKPEEKEDPVPYIIPEQHFDIFAEMGNGKLADSITTQSFEISPQVLYWEYKKYLAMVKRDSSEAFYRSQLPDSTMALPEIYREYMTDSKYDNYPVVGISWDNALNYLRWRTINANKDKIYDTIYRLPMMSEWVAAYRYFKTHPTLKDEMNHDYSDWTMNTKDESIYTFGKLHFKDLEYIYFAPASDAPVMKRKLAVGNSFHFGLKHLIEYFGPYYYEFHGYSHISFRYVIVTIPPGEMADQKKYGLLKVWGLNQ